MYEEHSDFTFHQALVECSSSTGSTLPLDVSGSRWGSCFSLLCVSWLLLLYCLFFSFSFLSPFLFLNCLLKIRCILLTSSISMIHKWFISLFRQTSESLKTLVTPCSRVVHLEIKKLDILFIKKKQVLASGWSHIPGVPGNCAQKPRQWIEESSLYRRD